MSMRSGIGGLPEISSLSVLSRMYSWNCECSENEELSGLKREGRLVPRLLTRSQYSSLKLCGLPLDAGALLMVHTGGFMDLYSSSCWLLRLPVDQSRLARVSITQQYRNWETVYTLI